MSIFEIILVTIIYTFGYGYVLANIIHDNAKRHEDLNTIYVTLCCIACLIWAFMFPLYISVDIYNKLNSK